MLDIWLPDMTLLATGVNEPRGGMPIKKSSYVTWNTSETLASVQLPLNYMFFCLMEVFNHVILWHQCGRSISDMTEDVLTRYMNSVTDSTAVVEPIFQERRT